MDMVRACWMAAILCVSSGGGCSGGNNPEQVCTPEERKCSGSDVVKCNSAGSEWAYYKGCDGYCSGGECSADAPSDAYVDILADSGPEIVVAPDLPIGPDIIAIDVAEVFPDTVFDVMADNTGTDLPDSSPEISMDAGALDTLSEMMDIDANSADVDICQASCEGKECGDNGCDGTCGACEEPHVCSEEGLCELECNEACAAVECGSLADGCNCGECDDGDPCTSDSCVDGSCLFVAMDCDDGNYCTDDICELGACVSTYNVLDCDDGNICTDGDQCSWGECAGAYLPADLLEGLQCDCEDDSDCAVVEDGDICNGIPICMEKEVEGEPKFVCAKDATTALDCDDKSDCTSDTCDPVEGCIWDPDDGLCADGSSCTSDICTGEVGAGCSNDPVDDSTPCGDDWQCQNGECVCTPICDNKECGPDGCGQVCGVCQDPTETCSEGQCVCEPSCKYKQCGPDGCGGECGSCVSPKFCLDAGCVECYPGGDVPWDGCDMGEVSEFQVNQTVEGDQSKPSVAALPNGTFVVVWQSDLQDGSETGVYGRLFSEVGVALGDEFQIADKSLGPQQYPSAAGLSGGGFVVTWIDFRDLTAADVVAAVFSPTGEKASEDVVLNSTSYAVGLRNAVAGLPNDEFVVTWVGKDNETNLYRIFGRMVSDSGPIGAGEFVVSQGQDSLRPGIATFDDGSFAVVWESKLWYGSERDVYARLFSPSAVPATEPFQVNTTTDGSQPSPTVAALANGRFVVIWSGQEADLPGVKGYAQYFDSDGTAEGDELLVTDQLGLPKGLDVSVADGGVVRAVCTASNGANRNVYLFALDEVGQQISPPGKVNKNSVGIKYLPSIATLKNGLSAIAWESVGQDQSGRGIFAQLVDEELNNVFPCLPDCGEGECGADNCNGSCGECAPSQTCDMGTCVPFDCLPVCENAECGNDGCGGSCGECECGHICVGGTCTYNACELFECGDDGCGGQCGSCSSPLFCGEGICACVDGEAPPWDGCNEGVVAEFIVNTDPVGSQTEASVASMPAGGFAVVWSLSGAQIWGQVFTASGSKVGADIPLSSYKSSDARVTGTPADTYVAAWRQTSQQKGLWGTILDSAGTTVAGPFSIGASPGLSDHEAPRLAAIGDDGSFAVVWRSTSVQDEQPGFYSQFFNQMGAANTSPQILLSAPDPFANHSPLPDVIGLSNQTMAVVWAENNPNAPGSTIWLQFFNAVGASMGPALAVSSTEGSPKLHPRITRFADDRLAVVWTDYWQDGDGAGICAQLLSPAGVKLGEQISVNSHWLGNQYNGDIAAWDTSSMMVVWTGPNHGGWSDEDGFYEEVFGRLYTSDGVALGDEFQLNTHSDSFQMRPTAAALADGFVVAWDSMFQDGDGAGIFARAFLPTGGSKLWCNSWDCAFSDTDMSNWGFEELVLSDPPPDFEKGTDQFSATATENQHYQGSRSCQLTWASTDSQDFYQSYFFPTGDAAVAQFKLWLLDSDSAGHAKLGMAFYDVNGLEISKKIGIDNSQDGEKWAEMEISLDVPLGATSVRGFLRLQDAPMSWDGDATIFIDEWDIAVQ